MAVTSGVRDYVNKMLSEVTGIKALLLDDETLGIVSLVLSQSDILHKEVFLVDKLGAISDDEMPHLKAVCFIRPTPENVNVLKHHLAKPRFPEYNLYFSNILNNTYLHVLADSDEKEVVKQVQEYFGDVFAVDPFHFTINFKNNYLSYLPLTLNTPEVQNVGERSVQAIASIFLQLKKRPVIRYQKGSDACRRIALEAGKLMYEKEKPLFDFRKSELAPLLLVIDRRDDPVTPLLNQWTYQAMVHELFGIENNRVNLKNVPDVPKEDQEMVLSSEQDEFFKANMYENYGDVTQNVAKLRDDFGRTDSNKKGNSIEELAQILENYHENRRQTGTVFKHVLLMSAVQSQVLERNLMAVSQVEQDLACSQSQAGKAFEAVMALLDEETTADVDRLRLVMLYCLRYEKDSSRQIEAMMKKLTSKPSKFKPALVYTLLKHCGEGKRTADLYGNKDIFNYVARNVKRGLKGVENVYTQHQPVLAETIENAVKGKLKDLDYPFIGQQFQQGKIQDLVVFVVGGTTYEEARAVAQYNSANAPVKVILGGTAVLNSSRFLSDLMELYRYEEFSSTDENLLDHL